MTFNSSGDFMLITSLIYLLISNALTVRKDKSILFSRITILALLLCLILTLNNIFTTPLDKGVGLYGGLFNVTSFTQSFNIFIFIISILILSVTSFYPRKVWIGKYLSLFNLINYEFIYNKTHISNKTGEQFRIMEYSLIIIFIISGAVFLMSASDLISVFLSIELQSYGLYILSTLYRDSEQATSGGLTYFLLGGLSSCFILLGSSLLYVNSGTTNLDGIYLINSISEMSSSSNGTNFISLDLYKPYYIHLSMIVLSVGFLFKISAAPFHFWSPDVYDSIPTIVTTFVAIIAKLSIFVFFLDLVYYIGGSLYIYSWTNCFLISSLLSLIIGSVLGLTQFRIKRLYAYSTINHVGFILLALSINSIESIQAYIFYIIAYTISNLNAFIILLGIGYSLYLYVYKKDDDKSLLVDENNSPVQLISQIKGYFYVNPYLALSLTITLFSFVGIPPLIGFFAKQMVLSAALDNGYVFMSLVAILTSVIGAVYYLNLIKQIFFFENDYKKNPYIEKLNLNGILKPFYTDNSTNIKTQFNASNIALSGGISICISILTLLLLLFIYTPSEWFSIANILTSTIYHHD